MGYNSCKQKMKKILFFLMCLTLFSVVGFAQNVVVQTTNNESNKGTDDCPYRINGICVTEDIGGVEVNFFYDIDSDHHYMVLSNYNTFVVSVLWSIELNGVLSGSVQTLTGNTILGAIEKKIQIPRCYINECNVTGLIVRKLAQ